MKVEIWSDIACPFCYIGKHHFERALESLPFSESIEVDWKSFELDPYANLDYEDDLYTLLANKYGQTRDWAINSARHMEQKGDEIGLKFNFDKSISTNTFDAHRLIHLAKSKGLQNEAKEALFKAYFQNGLHIGKHQILSQIGISIGLDAGEIASMLDSEMFAEEVRKDELKSQEYGIRGVPYFVIDSKYGISGAQPIEHFKQVLAKAHEESSSLIVETGEAGSSCDTDGSS